MEHISVIEMEDEKRHTALAEDYGIKACNSVILLLAALIKSATAIPNTIDSLT